MLDNKDIEKLNEVFATKEDIKSLVTKEDFDDFKNTSLSKLDQILSNTESSKQEKTMKDAQDKRQKDVLKIHNDALKRGEILSEEEVAQVDNLRVF